MIIDEHVGIQGNGNQGQLNKVLISRAWVEQRKTNQDAQSWFHSQEANILVDTPAVCKEWIDGLRGEEYSSSPTFTYIYANLSWSFLANQNTHIYGRLDEDGIWRDPKDGSLLDDMGSTKGGPLSSLKGLSGALKRVQ